MGGRVSVVLAIVCVKNAKNELCNSRESARKTWKERKRDGDLVISEEEAKNECE